MDPENTPSRHVTPVRDAYLKSTARKRLVLFALVALLVLLSVLELSRGSMTLTVGQVLGGLFRTGDAQTILVIWNLRLPHILCALIAGVALAMSGCVFQSTLHNPLASASTLGITQGASFGASMAIVVFGTGAMSSLVSESISWDNPGMTALMAFIGASISMVVITLLARFKDLDPTTIVLAGVALGALFSGATAIIQYFADDTKVAAIVFWTFGSLRRCTYPTLGLMAAVTAACGIFFALNVWNYNALETGESLAHSLGVRVRRVRLTGLILATLCASTAIAFCGTINFIGLVAPHIMRRILGSDYRFLLPGSALCGAALLLASDILSTLPVSGAILPIGAITAFVGVPFFIWLLVKGAHH
ncbi:MAG: iron ABC transporter permease [Eggerthellaceae bacterium]|nr:iron ABC transporter permease [Eggerthellaceae bacterium]